MSNITQQHNKELIISPGLQFFITLNQSFSAISRRFDHMGSMLGFNDFAILYHLYSAEDKKLRRIDLATKVGLTASGITRLLPSLEKLKLIARETDPNDARVSFVVLTSGGERIFSESIERAEHIVEVITPLNSEKELLKFGQVLDDMRRRSI